jgi:hypothetical protein
LNPSPNSALSSQHFDEIRPVFITSARLIVMDLVAQLLLEGDKALGMVGQTVVFWDVFQNWPRDRPRADSGGC